MCRNVVPVALIPNRSLTCDERMMSETAEVNPEATGPDTKSTRNPRPKSPIRSSTIPERKERRMALGTLP